MKHQLLIKILKFADYINNYYANISNLNDTEFENKLNDFVWPQALRRMREGKNMVDVLSETSPEELFYFLKKFELNV